MRFQFSVECPLTSQINIHTLPAPLRDDSPRADARPAQAHVAGVIYGNAFSHGAPAI